jgi:hypothetical protein
MGGGGSAPQAPDPNVTIPLQAKYDLENFYKQLDAMRSDSTNPYGSSTWNRTESFDQAGYDTAMAEWDAQYGQPSATPVGPMDEMGSLAGAPSGGTTPPPPNRASFTTRDYDQTSAFNPEMQGQWDQLQNWQSKLFEGFDPSKMPEMITDAGGLYSDDLADAIYRRTTRMSDRDMNEAQRGLEQRLAERGFQVGNEGYNTEMGRLGTQRSEHYSDAADRAQIAASQQALQEAGFTNSARTQEFNLKAALAQLLSGREGQMMSGLSGNATQFQAPGLQSPDVLGTYNNQYLGQLDAYNADQASEAAMFNSILALGASFLLPGAGAALGLGSTSSAGLGAIGGMMIPGMTYARP